jgi:hypothetical protein
LALPLPEKLRVRLVETPVPEMKMLHLFLTSNNNNNFIQTKIPNKNSRSFSNLLLLQCEK